MYLVIVIFIATLSMLRKYLCRVWCSADTCDLNCRLQRAEERGGKAKLILVLLYLSFVAMIAHVVIGVDCCKMMMMIISAIQKGNMLGLKIFINLMDHDSGNDHGKYIKSQFAE